MRRIGVLLVLLACSVVPPAAVAQTPLTGEFLASLNPATITSGNCDPDGTSTFTFEVSGTALGPYPGTFTETGRVTFEGPFTSGPVNNAGVVTEFEAAFTITGANGT